jgi:flagellin-specific chaperone FliS
MLKPANPTEAYRKVAFDACVAGSKGADLVRLCIEEVDAALARAMWAEAPDRADVRRAALARAQAGLGALRLGVDKGNPLGPALLTLYEAMAATVTACRFRYDAAAILRVRTDLAEISRAMLG